jgi:hypothetical protein
VRAMTPADRPLHTIFEAGDLVGRDAAGRMVIQLAVERRDFERLMRPSNAGMGAMASRMSACRCRRVGFGEPAKSFWGSPCKLDSLPFSGSIR